MYPPSSWMVLPFCSSGLVCQNCWPPELLPLPLLKHNLLSYFNLCIWCAVHLCESYLSTLCLRGFFSVTVRRGFLSLFYLHLFSPLPTFSRAIHIDQENIIKEEKTVHSALIKKSHMHSTEGFSLVGCIWQDCFFFFHSYSSSLLSCSSAGS